MKCRHVYNDSSGGVALILVIWVLVVLVAIVGEFSYSMRTEINIARNFKEEEAAYQLALSGIEQAKLELFAAPDNSLVYMNEDEALVIGSDSEDAPVRKDSFPQGSFSYTIRDEDSKLNINAASKEQIREIFLASGVGNEDIDTIVDSIMDWKDTNDLHMLNGAEEDYYQSLDNPYSCKDGPLDTIDELLLVKGMTKEILYGSVSGQQDQVSDDDVQSYSGVASQLTVYGTGRPNMNTASSIVLETVLGAQDAENILAQRENGPILRPTPKGKVSSDIFTIVSTGTSPDDKIKRSVRITVAKKGKKLETLYLNDNVI